ncbi:helix-turn-helix domain-containing protein [Enterococcus casseliflavus]|uniref:helix-turn-helix domain-containing protein n=1 Tax=Enterococcus casseliflavus TaxID=37734 RepID=UPI0039A6908F
MTFADNLKKYRKNNKLSQKDLAEQLELSRSYMSELESQKRKPSLETVKKIALKLDLSIADLVDDTLEDAELKAKNELEQVRQTALDQQVDSEQAVRNLRYYFKNLEQYNKEDEFEDVTLKMEELTAFVADLSEGKSFDELISVYEQKDPDFTSVIKQFYHF